MQRPSNQNRHARRPALEQYEGRILLSLAIESVGSPAAAQNETAYARDNSRIVVFYQAAEDHASRIFDDPFFFDAN